MAYSVEGDLLEVCNCNVLCPCWIGEDPDNGYCDATLAYRINSGEIDGVDMSGVIIAGIGKIPGNVLAGNWTRQLYIDEAASNEQTVAALDLLQGRKGGPMADLAQLIGRDLEPKRGRITFNLVEGRGMLAIEGVLEAVMEPYRGASGAVTTLNESIFSTIPGSPAFVSKAEYFRVSDEGLGMELELEKTNAIQGSFRFEHG
jgi:hypothetical protein